MDDEIYEECITNLLFSPSSSLVYYSNERQDSIPAWYDEERISPLLQSDDSAQSAARVPNDSAKFTLLAGFGDGKWSPTSVTEAIFRDVMVRFKFPKSFAQSILTNNGSLAKFIEYEEKAGKSVPTHLSIIIQTPNSPARNFSCVTRTCISTRDTTCFLFDKHTKHLDLLLHSLQARAADISHNPLTILSVLFEEHGFAVERYRQALDNEVVRMEKETGMSSLAYHERPDLGLSLRRPTQKMELVRCPTATSSFIKNPTTQIELQELPPTPNRYPLYIRRKSTTNTCAETPQPGSLTTKTQTEAGGEIDYAPLTRDLNACNTSLIFLDGLTNFECSLGSFLVEITNIVDSLCPTSLSTGIKQSLTDGLVYHLNLAEFRRYQGQSLQRRVQTQINVLYSLISQRDSKLSMSIAEDSKEIAAAAKRDSSSMKTIAALTLVFLPSTFVAVSSLPQVPLAALFTDRNNQGVFSSGIFSLQQSSGAGVGQGPIMVVAKSWWVYFAITIPLTLVTVGLWVLYLWWKGGESSRVEEGERRVVRGL